mmetsp:Transcript_10273/g.15632  ORF Transcript_10273/g.15632 Transcript_10273/m.15632 type:complete len:130 (+) Transcript_10273:178-567(+)
MNAFQMGICTYKWDQAKKTYVQRPFNIYVFPHSTLMDKKVTQFDPSAIKFLIDNKFDFNKLFKEGISYQRLCDKELVKDRIRGSFLPQSRFKRFYTHLGTSSKNSLGDLMNQVFDFVEKARKNPTDKAA